MARACSNKINKVNQTQEPILAAWACRLHPSHSQCLAVFILSSAETFWPACSSSIKRLLFSCKCQYQECRVTAWHVGKRTARGNGCSLWYPFLSTSPKYKSSEAPNKPTADRRRMTIEIQKACARQSPRISQRSMQTPEYPSPTQNLPPKIQLHIESAGAQASAREIINKST